VQGQEALEGSNAELRRFNRAVVGRELRMIELQRQVNELSQQLGNEVCSAPLRLGTFWATLKGDL